jgi:hypothetical protein
MRMHVATKGMLSYVVGAIDRGETMETGRVLTWILKGEPENALAWSWMAACLAH